MKSNIANKKIYPHKRLLFTCTIILLIALLSITSSAEHVSGYFRKDGTYVHSYYRNRSSSTKSNSLTYDEDFNSYDYFFKINSQLLQTSKNIQNRKTVNLYKGNKVVGNKNISSLVYVHGYYRKDGTYVRPHYRTHADNYKNNNFSTQGISTLKPLDKYPSYSYKSGTQTEESYLLYNSIVYNKELNNDSINTLEKYAAALALQDDNTLSIGKGYYKSLGLDDWISNIQSEFDVSEQITSQIYVSFILYDYLQSCSKTFNDMDSKRMEIIPYYCAVLDQYDQGYIDYDNAKDFAIWFYSHIISKSDAEEQIEMDLSQHFSKIVKSGAYDYIYDEYIPDSITYSSTMNSILEFYDYDDDDDYNFDHDDNDYYSERLKELEAELEQLESEYDSSDKKDYALESKIESTEYLIELYEGFLHD